MTEQQPQPEAPSGTLDASPLPSNTLSGPDLVRYHAVSDEDIARLKAMERPIALLLAGIFGGVFLATGYPVFTLIAAAAKGTVPFTLMDVGVLSVWAASFGVAVSAGLASVRGRTRVLLTLETIRTRPYVPAPVNFSEGGKTRRKLSKLKVGKK